MAASMNFDDADSQPLKDWMVKKLGSISDADPDVLADYVLALVKSDEAEAEVRKSCQESLEDFLEGNTKTFINDVFRAIKSKTYLPPNLRPPSKPANGSAATNGKAQSGSLRGGSTTSLGKRSRLDNQDFESDYMQVGRSAKAMRGGRGRGGNVGRRTLYGGAMPVEQQAQPFPSGMAQIDWSDPAQFSLAWQAMQTMMGFQMASNGLGHNPNAEPCRDFYEKGVCQAGATCPFDHGNEAITPGHNGSNKFSQSYKNTARSSGRAGRGTARGDRGGRSQRSGFSQSGPNADRRNTSIVVEQIPQDYLSEEAVRDFFSTFGAIRKITMYPEKHLATVDYEEWASGKAAYDSPKVIFDNRFVKVYWHRPEVVEGKLDRKPQDEAEPFDLEEFTRRQAEAQRKHEDHMRKVEEARIAREALEAKIQAHAEALRELKEKLPSDQTSPPAGARADNQTDLQVSETDPKDPQTAALQAQLKRLEEEAETLGLVSTEEQETTFSTSSSYYNQSWPVRGRGRGRGRGYAPRGAYRGRGGRAGYPGFAAGSVARLDNRPRNVEVQTVDTSIDLHDEEHSEALRTMLFNIGDFLSITPHPDASKQSNRAVIGFRERYVAESFIGAVTAASYEIPGVGKCELAWVANDKMKPPAVATASESLTKPDAEDKGDMEGTLAGNSGNGSDEEDEAIEDASKTNVTDQNQGEQEHPDHDVADDDDDRWMR